MLKNFFQRTVVPRSVAQSVAVTNTTTNSKARRINLWAMFAPLAFGLMLGSGLVDGLASPALWWGVAVHESCHALIGWLTGARHVGVELHGMDAMTSTSGCWYPLISIAGYTGSALVGAVLLRAATWNPRAQRGAAYTALIVPSLVLLIAGHWNGYWIATLIFVGIASLLVHRWASMVGGFLAAILFWQNFQDVAVLLFHPELHSDARLLAEFWHMPWLALPIATGLCLAGSLVWWRAARRWLAAWRR